MRLRLKTLPAALMGLSLFAGLPAQATTFSDFLTFDGPQHTPSPYLPPPIQGGGEDKLQDDSLSVWEDRDGGGTFTDGDIIYGMITLSEINASGLPSTPIGGSSQISIVFSTVINGAGSAAGVLNLDPVGNAADSADLRMLLDNSISSAAGLDDESIAVIVSTTTPDTLPADDPLNWVPGQITSDFTNVNNWFWEATFGILDGTQDFFEFDGSALLGGSERGGFSVQSSAFDPVNWLPVDVLDFGTNRHLADATLDTGTVDIASAEELANGWTFRDQSSYFVNPTTPVPEPGTLVLLGLGLAGMGFSMRRRATGS